MEIDQNNENRWGYDGKEPCAGRDLQPLIQDLVPATTSWRMRMPVGRSRVLVPDPSRGTRRRWQKDCGSENPEEQKNEGASWRGVRERRRLGITGGRQCCGRRRDVGDRGRKNETTVDQSRNVGSWKKIKPVESRLGAWRGEAAAPMILRGSNWQLPWAVGNLCLFIIIDHLGILAYS
jgi:hypothetical protein